MISPVKILLVDDEARNLSVLENVLQSDEHELLQATNAEEALLALLSAEVAVIVLDVQMPGTDGIELAHLIKQRERTQHIPIIFLTAFYQDEQRMLESYKVGAVDYLTKPVNPHVLRSKVAVFVDLHRKTVALRQSNAALEQEIVQRKAAETALREINDALEIRVEARTVALREARDAAERSGRAKDDFLAALSHELRTPLNPVLLLASEAAENPTFPEEARAQFLVIRKNVELEARLIDDLLDLTRISHGKLSLDLKTHDVHLLLEEAIVNVRPDSERKQINLEVKLESGSCRVTADEVRLHQIFWNLLRNAVKFTPEKGTVTVTSRIDPAAGFVTISVVDNGIGLSDAEIKRIYDAFAQGDHAASGPHRFGGLGLGLTISKNLVEQHGGRLIAKSDGPGKGATFEVKLPLAPAAAGSGDFSRAPDLSVPFNSAQKTNTGGAAAIARRKILLVEDHAATRTALATLLRRRQYDVALAGSLADARALVAQQTFDLLISDIGLPDGSGLDLMQELKSRLNLGGIALTGYGMEKDIGRTLSAGFVAHLTKPISIQALDKALAKLHSSAVAVAAAS